MPLVPERPLSRGEIYNNKLIKKTVITFRKTQQTKKKKSKRWGQLNEAKARLSLDLQIAKKLGHLFGTE